MAHNIVTSRGRFQVYPPPGTRPNKPRQLFPWLPGFYLFWQRLQQDNRAMLCRWRSGSMLRHVFSPDMEVIHDRQFAA